MPIKHPVDGETSYSVEEASVWLTERGLPTAKSSLNSARTNKTGPLYFKIGKAVWYRESALCEFLLSKISDDVSSTSEMKSKKRIMIEDKSKALSKVIRLRPPPFIPEE